MGRTALSLSDPRPNTIAYREINRALQKFAYSKDEAEQNRYFNIMNKAGISRDQAERMIATRQVGEEGTRAVIRTLRTGFTKYEDMLKRGQPVHPKSFAGGRDQHTVGKVWAIKRQLEPELGGGFLTTDSLEAQKAKSATAPKGASPTKPQQRQATNGNADVLKKLEQAQKQMAELNKQIASLKKQAGM